MLDMDRAREVFDGSEDFTIGIEEEFQILDPDREVLRVLEDLACTVHVEHVQVR